jgi:hypothetical protein
VIIQWLLKLIFGLGFIAVVIFALMSGVSVANDVKMKSAMFSNSFKEIIARDLISKYEEIHENGSEGQCQVLYSLGWKTCGLAIFESIREGTLTEERNQNYKILQSHNNKQSLGLGVVSHPSPIEIEERFAALKPYFNEKNILEKEVLKIKNEWQNNKSDTHLANEYTKAQKAFQEASLEFRNQLEHYIGSASAPMPQFLDKNEWERHQQLVYEMDQNWLYDVEHHKSDISSSIERTGSKWKTSPKTLVKKVAESNVGGYEFNKQLSGAGQLVYCKKVTKDISICRGIFLDTLSSPPYYLRGSGVIWLVPNSEMTHDLTADLLWTKKVISIGLSSLFLQEPYKKILYLRLKS